MMKQHTLAKHSNRWIAALLLFTAHCSLFTSRVAAQEVSVTVSPIQQVLPPQIAMYIDNPGKYFNITLTNNTDVTQNVYLQLNLEQTMPNSGLHVTTPARRMPQTPFTIPGGSTRQLTLVEMRTMFNHLPKNEVQTTPGLFDDYTSGAFGLLPEGQYRAQLTAYKWDPALATPQALSNPASGICNFTVCYKAQAPEFLTPITTGLDLLAVAKVNAQDAQFTWKQPIVACNPAAARFNYNFKVVEVLPGQQPDDAIDRNPVVYQLKGLLSPMAVIPVNIVKSRFTKTATYAAQVEAVSTNTNSMLLDYVMIENRGRSPYRLFKLYTASELQNEEPEEPAPSGDTPAEKDGKEYNVDISMGGKGNGDLDSLYILENPEIMEPSFSGSLTRKLYMLEDMAVEWTRPKYVGGEGEDQDKLQFEYTVELFRAEDYGIEDALKTKPVWSVTTKELSDTVKWEKIEDKVGRGDYMVLRVTPRCLNEKSIHYTETHNMVDYAMAERLTRNLFQCSSTTVIESVTPTKKSLEQLKNTTIGVGQYNLTIKTIEKVKNKDCYKGTGHIEWNPMGFKVMVAVKFDELYINDEDIAYDGLCITYQDETQRKLSDTEVVDKLFSDWGIDNYFGDNAIPYSSELQQKATSGIKNVAQDLNISKYYEYIKKGQSVWDQFLKGEISDLHLPLQLPKSINRTPCDIQIVAMKFAPTYATMDVLGEFTLPSSNYLKNDILVLGAPRLCISPDRVLPEAGTLALMGDFTITDPHSSFEMTFKAPKDVLEPNDGCFVAWKADALEMLDVDVDMKIPGLKKVDQAGNVQNENPILNFHASISDWDDWFAEASMDSFEPEDLPGWTFTPGETIIYDHSKTRSGDGMGQLPEGYDRLKAGMATANAADAEWQGLYIKRMSVVFPKMIEISDKKKSKDGRLMLEGSNMFFDGSGVSLEFGATNIFDVSTGKIGGWGISMDELKLTITQNKYIKSYFTGTIKTPLKGDIGYRCDMYAQGKDAQGQTDPNRRAYVFKTQQVNSLDFSCFLGSVEFDHDQTYFLVEAERFDDSSKDVTRVELSVGGTMSIDIAKDAVEGLGKSLGLKDMGKVISAHIPDIHMYGFRIANCKRWESKYTDNLSSIPSAAGKVISVWKEEYTIDDGDNDFYLSLGRWSVASMEKRIGCFKFGVSDYKFSYSSGEGKLSITGTAGVGGSDNSVFSASATIDILVKADLEKMDLSFGGVKFHDITFDTEMGGMTLYGKLSVGAPEGGPSNPDAKDDGYSGTLTFTMPGGLFYFDATGGFYKRTEKNDEYTWGWFDVTLGSKTGIDIPPVKITGITGGFYFNCAPPIVETKKGAKTRVVDSSKLPTPKHGMYGGRFGLTLASSAGEHLMRADVVCTVAYDAHAYQNEKGEWQGRLSRLVMDGELHCITGSDSKDGLINADVTISYVHEKNQQTGENEHYLSLDVTASVDASADAVVEKALSSFAGETFGLAQSLQSGLQSMLPGEKGSQTSGSQKQEKSNGAFKCSAGAEVNISFKINFDTKKWYFRIGEPNDNPDLDRRCRITFIDFKLGNDYIGFWAYLRANGYLCFGNELPNDGKLPAIPEDVRLFLDGKDVNGKQQSLSGTYESGQSDFASRMASLYEGKKCRGGLMFGGGVEGGFGVNAALVYASGVVSVGFDVALENFEKGTGCRELGSDHASGTIGWNGWYGMGQVYAMLKGEIGVQINLWFWKGKCSLVEAGVGALIQAGMPNPVWLYGKMRAHCSLLNGLYQFNHTLELKAGRICMPDHGNPLDNIELFAEAQPGVKANSSEGWKTETSPLVNPRFVTNYIMDTEVDLVDENMVDDYMWKNSGVTESQARRYNCRTYRFKLQAQQNGKTYENNIRMYNCSKGTGSLVYVGGSDDKVNYEVNYTLQPNTYYQMMLRGYAQEWFSSNHPYSKSPAGWDDPYIDGRRQAKTDAVSYFFRTGPLPDNIAGDIGAARPGLPKAYEGSVNNYYKRVRRSDVNDPQLYMKHKRDDLVKPYAQGSDKWEYKWRVRTAKKTLTTCSNYVSRSDHYEKWTPSCYLANSVAGAGPFFLELYRVNKGAGTNKKASQEVQQVVNQKKETTAQSVSGSNDAGAAMNKFFEQEAKEFDQVAVRETEYDEFLAERANEEVLFQVKFDEMVDSPLEADGVNIKGIMDYDDVAVAVSNFRDMSFGADDLNDYDMMKAEQQYWSPYAEMAWLSKWAFPGKTKIGAYRWSDTNIPSSEGLDFTLRYPGIRSKYVMKGNYEIGLEQGKPETKQIGLTKVMKQAHSDYIPKGKNIYGYYYGTVPSGAVPYVKTGYTAAKFSSIYSTELYSEIVRALISDIVTLRELKFAIVNQAVDIEGKLDAAWNNIRNLYNLGNEKKYSNEKLIKNYWKEYDTYVKNNVVKNLYNTRISLNDDNDYQRWVYVSDKGQNCYTYKKAKYDMPCYYFPLNLTARGYLYINSEYKGVQGQPTGKKVDLCYNSYFYNTSIPYGKADWPQWKGYYRNTCYIWNRIHWMLYHLSETSKMYGKDTYFQQHQPTCDFDVYLLDAWYMNGYQGYKVNSGSNTRIKFKDVKFRVY